MREKAIATLRQLHRYPIEDSFNQLVLQAAAGNWASWYEVLGVAKPLLQEAMRGILPFSQLGLFNQDKLIEVMRQHAIGIGDVKSGSFICKSLALIAWFDGITKGV